MTVVGKVSSEGPVHPVAPLQKSVLQKPTRAALELTQKAVLEAQKAKAQKAKKLST